MHAWLCLVCVCIDLKLHKFVELISVLCPLYLKKEPCTYPPFLFIKTIKKKKLSFEGMPQQSLGESQVYSVHLQSPQLPEPRGPLWGSRYTGHSIQCPYCCEGQLCQGFSRIINSFIPKWKIFQKYLFKIWYFFTNFQIGNNLKQNAQQCFLGFFSYFVLFSPNFPNLSHEWVKIPSSMDEAQILDIRKSRVIIPVQTNYFEDLLYLIKFKMSVVHVIDMNMYVSYIGGC